MPSKSKGSFIGNGQTKKASGRNRSSAARSRRAGGRPKSAALRRAAVSSKASSFSGPRYKAFSKIDGNHPFKKAVPGAYIEYEAHLRRGGEVFFFNFDLAKEMGLIPRTHPEVLTPSLRQAVLRAFSIQIINEYDIQHQTTFPRKDMLSGTYMATRYLQAQHPNPKGLTSGDGRSIWNGYLFEKEESWDIMSNGTGATRLSPATALAKKFFRTGDPSISYGCGRADLIDGVSAALMSEIFHSNGILTERVLAVIAFEGGTSINVRAGSNLLRPAHFFRPLKQGNYEELKAVTDYYLEREAENGRFPKITGLQNRYRAFLKSAAVKLAKAAAQFESEYIFCWLDWDGDNILVNGGIIDYGSVRQFGLFHHEYRYDDLDKMSTSIKEQRMKARYIVQTFTQLTDFLITGKRKAVGAYARGAAVLLYDREFEAEKDRLLLYKMGFPSHCLKYLTRRPGLRKKVRSFRAVFSYFEKVKSKKGKYKVHDGITWDAVFCMRDILRELPAHYAGSGLPMKDEEFIEVMRSHYATNKDVKLNPLRRRCIREFQRLYLEIVSRISRLEKKAPGRMLELMVPRAALINRYERVTGDAILYAAEKMIRFRKQLDLNSVHTLFREFVNAQILRPEYFAGRRPGEKIQSFEKGGERRNFEALLKIVKDNREGI